MPVPDYPVSSHRHDHLAPRLRPGTAAPPYAEALHRAVLLPREVQRACRCRGGRWALVPADKQWHQGAGGGSEARSIPSAYVGVDSRDPYLRQVRSLSQSPALALPWPPHCGLS